MSLNRFIEWLFSLLKKTPEPSQTIEQSQEPIDLPVAVSVSEPINANSGLLEQPSGENKRVQPMQSFLDTTLILKRDLLINSSGSIGALYFKGELVCHICEDTKRKQKVPGFTRIDEGTYKINLLKTSNPDTVRGRALRYDNRWPDWHDGIMELEDVPNFKYIQIHPGNKPDDTLGCLLPGRWNGRSLSVGISAITYERLYKKFAPIAEQGALYIQIIDGVSHTVD